MKVATILEINESVICRPAKEWDWLYISYTIKTTVLWLLISAVWVCI
jgi:hypothetical protein